MQDGPCNTRQSPAYMRTAFCFASAHMPDKFRIYKKSDRPRRTTCRTRPAKFELYKKADCASRFPVSPGASQSVPVSRLQAAKGRQTLPCRRLHVRSQGATPKKRPYLSACCRRTTEHLPNTERHKKRQWCEPGCCHVFPVKLTASQRR